nr:WhiB family transcriptional regulator [Nocardia transvalensis]
MPGLDVRGTGSAGGVPVRGCAVRPIAPIRGVDPATDTDRSCRGVAQNVFFPRRSDVKALAYAQDICEGCPLLRECAAYAAPLARSGALTEGLIATVLLPRYGDGQAARDAVAAELERVAATGRAVSDVVPAAALDEEMAS